MAVIDTSKLTGRGVGPLANQIKTLLDGFLSAVKVNTVPNSVNYLEFAGAAASAEPSISAKGTDADIDITLVPKGAGLVRFGTFTGSADVVTNGSIQIRDAGGTIRKLMCTA
jgi:hypothetical protein